MHVGVLASGRGSNFEALLAASRRGELGPARVVCLASDNAAAPAVATARRHGIAVCVVDAGNRRGRLEPHAEQEIVTFLQAQRVQLACLAGFMRILRGAMLDAYAGAILNVHPSLLPSFPGLDAPHQALEHGVKVSGCTVHIVDRGIDTGPILAQAAVPVLDGDTAESLSARILEREHEIYARAVRAWAEGRLQRHGRHVRGVDDITTTSHTERTRGHA